MINLVRAIVRRFLMWSAIMWLGLNGYQLIATTFMIPPFMDSLFHLFPGSPRTLDLATGGWPWLSLLFIVFMRQETHRWFSVRRGRRSADRLMVGWFVFIGTLLLVDWLEPTVTLHWPAHVMETTLWLAVLSMATWLSRLAHTATRRHLCSMLKHWQAAFLWSIRRHRAVHLQPHQGGSLHVPKAVTPTKRVR